MNKKTFFNAQILNRKFSIIFNADGISLYTVHVHYATLILRISTHMSIVRRLAAFPKSSFYIKNCLKRSRYLMRNWGSASEWHNILREISAVNTRQRRSITIGWEWVRRVMLVGWMYTGEEDEVGEVGWVASVRVTPVGEASWGLEAG